MSQHGISRPAKKADTERVKYWQYVTDIHFYNSGYGGLSLSIEGPSKAEIQCKDNEDGTLNISYKPTEPGYYIVNLKFADHHVDGSPFTVKVGAFFMSETINLS